MPLPNFQIIRSDGRIESFSDYRNKVVLVVNTATGCGLAGQFTELESLYAKFRDRGFTILAFPSDQFKQESIQDEDMARTCQLQFGTTFPLFQKTLVNGDQAHPLFKWLKLEKGGLLSSEIKWNFTKFLIDPHGQVVKRYSPTKSPTSIAKDIEAILPIKN